MGARVAPLHTPYASRRKFHLFSGGRLAGLPSHLASRLRPGCAPPDNATFFALAVALVIHVALDERTRPEFALILAWVWLTLRPIIGFSESRAK